MRVNRRDARARSVPAVRTIPSGLGLRSWFLTPLGVVRLHPKHPGAISIRRMLLEDARDLAYDIRVREAVVTPAHQQLGGRACKMGAGIRHLAIAPVGPGRTPPVGDDRVPLDVRTDGQAVDGQQKGGTPGGLIDARRQSFPEGRTEYTQAFGGQEG